MHTDRGTHTYFIVSAWVRLRVTGPCGCTLVRVDSVCGVGLWDGHHSAILWHLGLLCEFINGCGKRVAGFQQTWRYAINSPIDIPILISITVPGMATRLVFRVPGSAGTAGREPSMDTVSWELVREMTSGDFLFLCKAFWMEAGSVGRLASWWNTLRLRMMAYTRLQFPGGGVNE